MFGFRTRALTGIAWLAAASGLAGSAQAQFRPFSPCSTCGAPAVAMVQPIMQASACNCPCMQAVTEPVYQQVNAVEYRTVQKDVEVPRVVTEYIDQPITTYQTAYETKTADVTSYINQTVSECQQVSYNQSYWRTAWQPINKAAPCTVDQRPGLMGEFNRMGMAFRNSFTPNYVARREYVPNVITAQVPVQRTVQIPTTRQVSYNVAKLVPVQTTQKVAVQRTVMEKRTITAQEPYTVQKTVQVGNRVRMAYVDPTANAVNANAGINPTVAKPDNTRSAINDKPGTIRENSAPANEIPLRLPTYQLNPVNPVQQDSAQPILNNPPTANRPAPTGDLLQVTAWKKTRDSVLQADAEVAVGSDVKVVQK